MLGAEAQCGSLMGSVLTEGSNWTCDLPTQSTYWAPLSYSLQILFDITIYYCVSRWEKVGADKNTLIWLACLQFLPKCFADFFALGSASEPCNNLAYFLLIYFFNGWLLSLWAILKQSAFTLSAWPLCKKKKIINLRVKGSKNAGYNVIFCKASGCH